MAKKSRKGSTLFINITAGKEREKKKKLQKNRGTRVRQRQKEGGKRERGKSGRASLSPPHAYPHMNLSCCLIVLVSQPRLPALGLYRHWLVDILADRVHFAESQQEVSLLLSRKLQLFSLWHMPLFAHSAERAFLPCACMCVGTHLCTVHLALLHAQLPVLYVIACGRQATCQAGQHYMADVWNHGNHTSHQRICKVT